MMTILAILTVLSPAQNTSDNNKIEKNMEFVKIGVMNSNNNNFTSICCDTWLKTFDKKDIVMIDSSGEKVIGKAVCLTIDKDWVVAKCLFDKMPPKGYVLRIHSKPIRYNVTNENQYNIQEAKIIRFLLVPEINASKFD